jgi:hypothetical protein
MYVEHAVPSLVLASTVGTTWPAIETVTPGRAPQEVSRIAKRITENQRRDRID